MLAPGSHDDLSTSLDELSIALEGREPESLNIVSGDLNGDLGSIVNGRNSKQPTKQGLIIHNFCARHHLLATNLSNRATGPMFSHHGPTGSSMIDYILILLSLESRIVSCGVVDDDVINTSDHNPVFATCKLHTIPNPVISNVNTRVLKWGKMGRDIIAEKYTTQVDNSCHGLLERYMQDVPTCDSIDNLISALNKCLHRAASRLPKSKFRRHLKPFWCHEMNLLKIDKIRTYNIWVDAGRPRDKGSDIHSNYIASKKAFNKRLHILANEYENENIRRIIESAEIGSSTFWNILSKCRSSNGSKVFAVQNRSGLIVHSLPEVLEVWRTHFSDLCTPKCDPSYDNDHFIEVNSKVDLWRRFNDKDEFLCYAFSSEEVVEAIDKLNSGKAPGIDNITAEHLKYGGDLIPKVITMLFNWIVDLEYIPRNFREGKIRLLLILTIVEALRYLAFIVNFSKL